MEIKYLLFCLALTINAYPRNHSTLGFEWINRYENMTEEQENADRKARLKSIIDQQNKEFEDLEKDIKREMEKS